MGVDITLISRGHGESSSGTVLYPLIPVGTYGTTGIAVSILRNMFTVMYSLSVRLTTILRIYLAFRRSGLGGVKEEVYNLVLSLLNNLYKSLGLSVRDEICFSCLADAGVIDDRTALYLTTLYLSIEELLDEPEEEEGDVRAILREVTEELGELVDILTQVYYIGETPGFVTSPAQETQLSIPYTI